MVSLKNSSITQSMPFDSNEWWNEQGPFRLLHEWLPLRLEFILKKLASEHDKKQHDEKAVSQHPLLGLSILDVGCGAGLTSEPLARLGATVIGIDPEPAAILCAKNHLAQYRHSALDLSYVCQDPLTWECPRPMDAIVIFEVLEHVENPLQLVEKMLTWLRPGGRLIGSTIHRTTLSAVIGIGLAETILGWVPKGTHRWDRFLKPEELTQCLEDHGGDTITIQGCMYLPLLGWRYSAFSGINYFFSAAKKPLIHQASL